MKTLAVILGVLSVWCAYRGLGVILDAGGWSLWWSSFWWTLGAQLSGQVCLGVWRWRKRTPTWVVVP